MFRNTSSECITCPKKATPDRKIRLEDYVPGSLQGSNPFRERNIVNSRRRANIIFRMPPKGVFALVNSSIFNNNTWRQTFALQYPSKMYCTYLLDVPVFISSINLDDFTKSVSLQNDFWNIIVVTLWLEIARESLQIDT